MAGWLSLSLACGGDARPQVNPDASFPPDPGSGPFLCSVADGFEFSSIEDFELGAAGNGWFTNNDVCATCQPLVDDLADVQALLAGSPADKTLLAEQQADLDTLAPCREKCAASQQPCTFDKPLPAERMPRGRCQSWWALHGRTQRLGGWGGNYGVRFTPPRDAHEFKGIAFWGRAAPGSRNAVRVELADKYTDEKYVGPDGGPICNPSSTLDSLTTGCDKFGGYAVLGDDWQLVLIPFDELRQAGWGRKAPDLDLAALRYLSFTFGPGSWDLWIDDVAFYR